MGTLISRESVFGIEVVTKSLLLCLIAMLAVRMLQRASAATRHTVWLSTLVGLLLLPGMGRILPSWQAVTLPAASVAPLHTPAAPPAFSLPKITYPPVTTPPLASVSEGPQKEPAVLPPPIRPPQTFHAPTVNSIAAVTPAHSLSRDRWVMRGCVLLWLAGLLTLLAQILFGLGHIVRLWRCSVPVSDPEILTLLQEVHSALPVTLRISTELSAPITWGAWRPQIVLPAEAAGWTQERLRAVLLHEVGHCMRQDWLLQMMANVICACYWFHPLVWFVTRQMRMESERACDDLVLLAGVRASDYASLLLEMAKKLGPQKLSMRGAVSMAQPALIETRLRAILDSRQHRKGLSHRLWMVGMTVGGCLFVALASAQVGTKSAMVPHAFLARMEGANSGVTLSSPRIALDSMSEDIRQVASPIPSSTGSLRRSEPPGMTSENASTNLLTVSPAVEGDGMAELSAIHWGRVQDGMQLGIRLGHVPSTVGKPIKEMVSVLPGGHLLVTGYLRNVGRKEIAVAMNTNPGDSDQAPSLLNKEGKEIQKCSYYDPCLGLPSALLLILKPGEIFIFDHPGLTLKVHDAPGDNAVLSEKLSPGDYLFQQGFGYTLAPIKVAKEMFAEPKQHKSVVGICITRTLTPQGDSKQGRALVVPAEAFGVDRTQYTKDRYWRAEAPFRLLPEQKEGAAVDQPALTIKDKAVLQEISWGDAQGGLEAGIRFVTPKQQYEDGDRIDFDVYVRNVLTHTLYFAFRSSPQFDTSTLELPTIAGPNSKSLPVYASEAIEKPVKQVALKPGEVVKISQSRPHIGSQGEPLAIDPVAWLPTPDATGVYTVKQNVTLTLLTPANREQGQDSAGSVLLNGIRMQEAGPPLNLSSGILAFHIVSAAMHTAWGKPVNGLQAGLSFLNDRRRYKIGDSIRMSLYIRNVSNQPAEFQYVMNGNSEYYPIVVDRAGTSFPADMVFISIYRPAVNCVLKPGEMVRIGQPEVTLAALGSGRDKNDIETRLPVKPGSYRMHMIGMLQPVIKGAEATAKQGDRKPDAVAAEVQNASPLSGEVEFAVEP